MATSVIEWNEREGRMKILDNERCYYCDQTEDAKGPTDAFRPYAPGGAYTHFSCMMATPEREKLAKRLFGECLDSSTEKAGPGGFVVISNIDPPYPLPLVGGKINN